MAETWYTDSCDFNQIRLGAHFEWLMHSRESLIACPANEMTFINIPLEIVNKLIICICKTIVSFWHKLNFWYIFFFFLNIRITIIRVWLNVYIIVISKEMYYVVTDRNGHQLLNANTSLLRYAMMKYIIPLIATRIATRLC